MMKINSNFKIQNKNEFSAIKKLMTTITYLNCDEPNFEHIFAINCDYCKNDKVKICTKTSQIFCGKCDTLTAVGKIKDTKKYGNMLKVNYDFGIISVIPIRYPAKFKIIPSKHLIKLLNYPPDIGRIIAEYSSPDKTIIKNFYDLICKIIRQQDLNLKKNKILKKLYIEKENIMNKYGIKEEYGTYGIDIEYLQMNKWQLN